MKIRDEISRLGIGNALLVVMGSHRGILHELKGDEINQADDIRVDTPVYSDNEGMFRGGAPGGAGYGSVLELKKGEAQKDFSKLIAGKVKEALAQGGIASVYLYAPLEMKSLIDADWDNEMKRAVKARFDGNYVSESPVKLLEMIKDADVPRA